jgi:lysophospholipase L1-like esterase
LMRRPWAYGCEVGVAAYSGQGWTIGGQTNAPPLFTPGNDTLSSWNKLYTGQSRSFAGLDYIIILNMGGNDTRQSATDAAVTASVSGVLAAIRGANSTAKIIVVPSYEGDKFAAIQAGFNNYQTATPDSKCLFVDPGLTTTEQNAINAASGSAANATYLSTDGIHPSAYGQQTIGSKVIQAVQAKLNQSGGGRVFGGRMGLSIGIGL